MGERPRGEGRRSLLSKSRSRSRSRSLSRSRSRSRSLSRSRSRSDGLQSDKAGASLNSRTKPRPRGPEGTPACGPAPGPRGGSARDRGPRGTSLEPAKPVGLPWERGAKSFPLALYPPGYGPEGRLSYRDGDRSRGVYRLSGYLLADISAIWRTNLS